MATSVSENPLTVSDVLSDLGSSDQFDPGLAPQGRWRKWALRLVLAAVVGVLGIFGLTKLVGSMEAKSTEMLLTHVAKRGELLVTVTEDGNLESAQNVDIKCEVEGGSTILWIIEDGKEVKEGEDLAKLESSQIEDKINQQRIVYEKARATHIQAQKDYEVAKISVQEYIEGTYRQNIEKAKADIIVAEANLSSAKNALDHTNRMFRKGYVTPLQRDTQEFAVERAKLDLAAAKTAEEVLEKFTKAKTLQDLESKRDTAEAKKNSEKAAFDLEEARLKRLEAQLKKCTLRAPKAGMVVYANEQGRSRFPGQQAAEIKEGAVVREQQNIFRLPDLGNMQVKVTVHESKVERIRRGMRARIGIQGREFQGTVISVANQPEPTGFHSAAVKEYATIVKIDGESKDLRPGMTAEVEILVAALQNVLAVPVAAVFEQRGQTFCCVKKGQEVEKRPVEVGMTNDKFVEVRRGLEQDEEVVLNPRAVVPETVGEIREEETVDVNKKFGSAPVELGGGAGDNGRPGPGGPDKKGRGKRDSQGAPGERGGRGPSAAMKAFFSSPMQFDKDGDKRVSRDEAPEDVRSFFLKLDANGDGFIDQAEIDALRARRPPGGDAGGDRGGGPPAP